MVDLGTLAGLGATIGTAINDAGTVVGSSSTSNGNTDAFIYSNGQITDLKVGALQGYTGAYGINNAGVIVGDGYVNPNTYAQPYDTFIYNNGNFTMLSTPGGTTSVQGINSTGTVVGGYARDYGNYVWYAYTYSNGTLTTLTNPWGGRVTYGLAINDAGTVVGYYFNPNSYANAYAFSYSNGTWVSLGTLPGGEGGQSSANGINNVGTIVGYSNIANGNNHAFSYSNGTMTDLGTLPGFNNSSANAINIAGIIVGFSSNTNIASDNPPLDPANHAFVYNNGTMTDLNTVVQGIATTLIDATAINTLGQIVAVGSDGHSYLLTPNPTYTISGQITSGGTGISGVTVTLTSGGTTIQTTTDSQGNYIFSVLANGSYTVTPSKTGYTFTPSSLNVTVNGSNSTGDNITATPSPNPTPVGYSPAWLIITLVSLMIAGGFLLRRRMARQQF